MQSDTWNDRNQWQIGLSGRCIFIVPTDSTSMRRRCFSRCETDVKHGKNMNRRTSHVKKSMPWRATKCHGYACHIAIPCYTVPFLAISCYFFIAGFAFFFPLIWLISENIVLWDAEKTMWVAVFWARDDRNGIQGELGELGELGERAMGSLWGFYTTCEAFNVTRCDKMWQERNAVRFPELKNFRNVSAFLRFGQAEDIDPRFPWPLQHGFRKEFSIGGRVKGLRNDRVRLYPPNPFLLYDTKRKHEETRTFPTDKLKEYTCICVYIYIYIILEYVYIYMYIYIYQYT